MQVFGKILDNHVYRERKGAYGIAINENNDIAVIQMPHGDFLPGGGIEGDESEEACLHRELMEETGHKIVILSHVTHAIQYGFSPKSKAYLKLVGSFYSIKFLEKTDGKIEDDHILVWKSLQTLRNTMRLKYQLYAVEELLEQT